MNSPLNTLARVACGIIGAIMAFWGVIMAWVNTNQISGSGFAAFVQAACAVAAMRIMYHWARREHTTWKPAQVCWATMLGLNVASSVVMLACMGWPELDTGGAIMGLGQTAAMGAAGMCFWKLITMPWPRIPGDPAEERQTTGAPGDDAWTPEWLKRNGKEPL